MIGITRPHPNPLPQAKEHRSTAPGFSDDSEDDPLASISVRLNLILPLLGGDYRGEVERSSN